MLTLKFKAQPTNAFFATDKLLTTAERAVIESLKSLSRVETTKQCL